jgi:hypothetical protein
MKRFLLVVVAIISAGGASACNKPSADDCRLAVAKVRELYGTDSSARNSDTEGDVRSCKGGSTKEAVACAIKATSLAELKACDFMSPKTTK